MKDILTYVWGSGTASVACAAFAFSVSSALVRPVSRDVSVFELVFVRSVLSMGLSFLANAGSAADSLFGKRENLPLLVLRGLSGALAMNVYYASIQRLLLAEAMALLFLNPAIVAVLAYAVLGERLTWKQLIGIVGSLVGMLAVVRPPLNERWGPDRAWGVVFGGMSAVLAAVAYITIRKIGKKEASLTIAVYFHGVALITSIVGLSLNLFGTRFVIPRLFPDVLCMVLIAPCSFLAQLLISRGFQLSTAAVGAAVNYLQVFFGALFGFFFYSEPLSMISVVGIFLIFGGVLLISMEKQAEQARTVRRDDEEPPPL